MLIAVGLCLTVIAALLFAFPPTTLQQAKLRLYDHMLSGRTSPAHTTVPVLVGVDEESLHAYGQWPWPRYRLAMLVERLQQLGAEVIALDFLMPEPDRSSPEVIQVERQRDLDHRPTVLPSTFPDSNSQRLSAAIGHSATTLGYYLDFSDANITTTARSSLASPPRMVFVSAPGSTDAWPKPKGVIRSLPVLTAAASAEGFVNSKHDIDGTLRRVPLLMAFEGKIQPSLSLSAMMLAEKNHVASLRGNEVERTLQWGNRQIPLDSTGNLLLDFRSGQAAFPYFSARSILADELEPHSLRGKIVLVGAWATGLGDSHLTPSGRILHGLEIHATVIDNILGDTFIVQPGWGRSAELLALLLFGIGSTLLLSRAGYVVSLVAIVLATVGCYWAARLLLTAQGLYLSPFLPMATLITITSILGLLKYGIEARKLQHRTLDLLDAQDTVIISMSALAEIRDRDTGNHILRTQRYVEILARQLSKLKKYAYLDETSIQLLGKSAPLHDIGKVGIPDSILQKPGKLTTAEFEIMKTHTLIGAQAIARILIGTEHPEKHEFLSFAQQMIISHHEWWDGCGYPYGLRGEEIPLAGRLMALADVYDASVSQRTYKSGLSHEQVRDEILRKSGSQFDPDIVVAFIARNEEFLETSQLISSGAKHGANLSAFPDLAQQSKI